jgi:hypothetical protein
MASEPVPPSVASVASVSAADEGWALKTEGGDVDLTGGEHTRSGWSLKEIREKLGEAFNSAVKQHGGPMQFLMHRYPNTQTKEQYAKRLWQEFPPLDSHPPHLGWPVPSVAETERTANSEVVLHLAQFDFSPAATMKGPPGLRTATLLADDILTSGLITVGDPVLVVCPLSETSGTVPSPWPAHDAGKPTSEAFSMGYIKGAARICTLHVLVTLCLDDNLPLVQASAGWGEKGEATDCVSRWGQGTVQSAA